MNVARFHPVRSRCGSFALAALCLVGCREGSGPEGSEPPPLGGSAAVLGAPSASASAETPSAETPSASAETPSARPPMASSGEAPASPAGLAALKRQERAIASIEDALAVASAHSERARAEARSLSADLAADPAALRDGGTAAHTLRLALDPDTAPIVLEAVARLATPEAADLLDELARSGDPGARLTLLARDLRDLPALVERRSEPLAAAIQLDDALAAGGSCDAVLAALRRVERVGDSRARGVTDRLLGMTGCGRKGTDDCWPCLRDADGQRALEAARGAAQTRRFVGPWVTRRTSAPGGTSRSR
jgi:hypothetical protein